MSDPTSSPLPHRLRQPHSYFVDLSAAEYIETLESALAIAEKRIKTCERFAEPYTSATGSRWWEIQLQGETFLEAVDAAGRDTP